MRSLLLVVLAAGTASAHPVVLAIDPPPAPVDWRRDPAFVEWSTWIGFGAGVASSPPVVAARGAIAVTDLRAAWTFSAGIDATLPLTQAVRLGPWLGLHDLEPMGGVELAVTRRPASLDMFWYEGEGVWSLRAGGGRDHVTAALAWGYRCPWTLWGTYSRATRYEIGARVVLAATRAYNDPSDWTATLGLEVEPVGALRYLLGIRSWY